MPLESCQKYTATLSEILALTPVVQTIADATDVPGVRLEWLNGAWYGDCGFPSAAQHSALLAANAYNSLGVGSRMTPPSGPVTWRGASAGGWVAEASENIYGTTVVAAGDSITSQSNQGNWFDSTIIALGGARFLHLGNTAVQGRTSRQIIDAFDSEVAPLLPDEVWLQMGSNDTGTETAASYSALLSEYLEKCKNNLIKLRIFCIPPKDSAISIASQFRQAAKIFAAQNGIECHDIWGDLINPATGGYNAADTVDGVHPSTGGFGKAVTTAVAQLLALGSSASVPLPEVNEAGLGLNSNPLFITDTNADGIADNWTLNGGPAVSTLPSVTFGKAQRMAVSSGSSQMLARTGTVTLPVGKTSLSFCGDIVFTGTNVTKEIKVEFLNSSSVVVGSKIVAKTIANLSGTFFGVSSVPDTATKCRFSISASGSAGYVCQLDVSRAQIY